ncbi:MAG: ABC transporter substrate-binding protein [Planctomycetota bacterium]
MKTARWTMTACLLLLSVQASRPATAAPEPKPEPTQLTFSEYGLPRSVDPHRAGDVVSSRHVMHVYETLLEYAPFGECRLQPCLVEEFPTYDEEKLTYTFKLRDDVSFADDECFPEARGRKMTADDVVFSIKRLAALPDSGGYWILEGQIAGLDIFRYDAIKLTRRIEHKDGSTESIATPEWWQHFDEDVSGLKAVDSRTVQIKLNQPYPQFLHAITLSYGAILPIEAAKKYDLNTHMVGTGPYVMKSLADDVILYERNPNYRAVRLRDVPEDEPLKRFEGALLPLTDVLRYEIIPESGDSFQLFLDKVLPISGIDQEQFAMVINEAAHKAGKHGDDLLNEKYRKQGIHLIDYIEPTVHYISFNMNDATFGSKAGDKGRALRKAVAKCINRADYINKHLNGRGEPGSQLVPPGVLGHSDECVLQNQQFDLDGARKLLKEAGFTVNETDTGWSTSDAGKQIELQVCFRSQKETTMAYGEWLTEALAQIGISFKPKYMSFRDFLRTQDEGKGQAYDAGWVMDVPDAQNMLQLLYSPHKPPGINSAGFANPTYDKLYEEMSVLRDDVPEEAERKRQLIVEMHKVLDDETPWVLMEYRKIYSLGQEGFLSPPPNPFAYNFKKYARWVK